MPNPKPLPQFTAEQIRRFWSYVDKRAPEECWPWKGHLKKPPLHATNQDTGYGSFSANYQEYAAHRVAYFLTTGIDLKQFALHHCDNPPCQNPRHIFEGSQRENMQDMIRKGRLRKPRGEDHYAVVLDDAGVELVRWLIFAGMSQNEIARRFAVSKQLVSLIRHGHRLAA